MGMYLRYMCMHACICACVYILLYECLGVCVYEWTNIDIYVSMCWICIYSYGRYEWLYVTLRVFDHLIN